MQGSPFREGVVVGAEYGGVVTPSPVSKLYCFLLVVRFVLLVFYVRGGDVSRGVSFLPIPSGT